MATARRYSPTPYSPSPALTAYKVYALSTHKLEREARRQTPDLHRMVAHANMIDSVRRWSREASSPTEHVVVDSSDDSASDEEEEVGEVAIFECEPEEWEVVDDADAQVADAQEQQHQQDAAQRQPQHPRRKAPAPPNQQFKYDQQSWRVNRPVLVRERSIEGDSDD